MKGVHFRAHIGYGRKRDSGQSAPTRVRTVFRQ
jgi:hypothetical protein